jgi:hypothetical protein
VDEEFPHGLKLEIPCIPFGTAELVPFQNQNFFCGEKGMRREKRAMQALKPASFLHCGTTEVMP